MGDLTKNISAHELACDCKYPDCRSKEVAHMPLVMAMQGAVDYFSEKYEAPARIVITDGNRCFKNNVDIQLKYTKKTRAQAEKSKSRHLFHVASDHHIKLKIEGDWKRLPSTELYDYYDRKFPDSCGLILYFNRVHLDMRQVKYRKGG